MRRYWRYIIKSIFWILLVIVGLTLLYRLENDGSKKESASKDSTYLSRGISFTRGNIHMDVAAGYQGKVRLGRYVQLKADIRNTGGDFSGVLQVLPGKSGQEKTYERSFEIQGGESRTIRMYIPVGTESDILDVTLLQGRQQVIYTGEIWLDRDRNEDEIYTGICCGSKEKLGYMEGADTNVTYLSKKELPVDVRGLDWLDVFVVSNVDLQTLEEQQVRALINWVRSGGTLVLADSGEAKEISPFRGKLFEWRKTKSLNINTNFGLNRKSMKRIRKIILREATAAKTDEVKNFLRNNLSDELYEKWKTEINKLDGSSECIRQDGEVYRYLSCNFSVTMLRDFLSLQLTAAERKATLQDISIQKIHRRLQKLDVKGGTSFLETRKGDVVFQEKSIGLGKLIVSGVSLQLPSRCWDVHGNYIKTLLLDHSADRKTVTVAGQRQKTENSIISSGLQITDWNKLPNLKLYMVFLGIYILVTGIMAGHFLRKSRHRMIIWGILPVSALVFSVLIYLTGTSTRLEGQCINYLNQMELDQQGVGVLKSSFRVINDQTGQYDVAMDGGPVMDYGDTMENTGKSVWQEMIMQQGEGKNTAHIGKVPCFEGIDLQSKTSVRLDGGVEASISIIDLQLLGNIKNNFSYKLEDCMVYHRGMLYYLGDIEGKDVHTIEEINRVTGECIEEERNYEKFAEKLFGRRSKHKMTRERIRRRWALLEACIKNVDDADIIFYSFIPKGQEVTGWYETQKAKQQNMLGGLEQISGIKSGETGIMMRLPGRDRTGEDHRILRGGD